MRRPQFIWEVTMKMTELLPLNVYPFTFNSSAVFEEKVEVLS